MEEKKGFTVWIVFSAGVLVTWKNQVFGNELFSPQILRAFIIFISKYSCNSFIDFFFFQAVLTVTICKFRIIARWLDEVIKSKPGFAGNENCP